MAMLRLRTYLLLMGHYRDTDGPFLGVSIHPGPIVPDRYLRAPPRPWVRDRDMDFSDSTQAGH